MIQVFAAVLYGAYILRQSFWGAEHQWPLLALMTVSSLVLMACGGRTEIDFLRRHHGRLMLALASILLAGVMFSEWSSLLAVLAKAAMVMLLALHASKDRRLLISMADAGLVVTLLIGLLAQGGVIPSQFSETAMWTKNYFGFINPNIAPYFLFASAFVFYFYGRMLRFFVLTLIIVALWLQFQVFSRTFIAGGGMLLLYVLVARSHFWEAALTRVMTIFLALATGVYLILAVLLIGNVVNARSGLFAVVDYFFSQRFWFLSGVSLRITDAGSIFRLRPFDSIYYEAVFMLGPYLAFALGRLFFLRPRDLSNLNSTKTYGLYVFLTVGLFEGLFLKFSPMIVVVSMALASMLPARPVGFGWLRRLANHQSGPLAWVAVLVLSATAALSLYLVPVYRISAGIVSADSEVAPSHSAKFSAILGYVDSCSRVHCKIERKGASESNLSLNHVVVDVNDPALGRSCLEDFSALVGADFSRRVDWRDQHSGSVYHYFVKDAWLGPAKIEILDKTNLSRYVLFAVVLSILVIGFHRFELRDLPEGVG